MTDISVVIPAYNAEEWVARAIRSALAQSAPPREVIVVNDGSTDRTAEIVGSFGECVQMVSQENRGLSAARNVGAGRASGSYLYFLDSDDELEQDALLEVSKVLANETCDVVIPNCWIKSASGSTRHWVLSSSIVTLTKADVGRLIRANWLHPNAAVSKSAWAQVRFDENLCSVEDLDFWLRILLSSRCIVVLDTPLLVKYEDHVGRMSLRLATMRHARRKVLWKAAQHSKMSLRLRALAVAFLIKAFVGEQLIVRHNGLLQSKDTLCGEQRQNKPVATVVQVWLDEPGGGPKHVSRLTADLDGLVETIDCLLDRDAIRRPLGFMESTRSLVRSRRRDGALMHAHGVRAATVVCAVCLFSRTPYVLTVHGFHAIRRNRGWRRLTAQGLAALVLTRSAGVMVLSDADMEEAQNLTPRRTPQLIRAGFSRPYLPTQEVARRIFGLGDNIPVVCWIGRFANQKDPVTMIRVGAALAADGVYTILAGDGPLAAEVKTALARSDAATHVRLVGWLDDPSSLLAAADIFVSTSRWEGLPIACLEAASAGLALVLSECPGNTDVLTRGIPAETFPVGNPAAAVAAIKRALTERDGKYESASIAEAVAFAFPQSGLRDDVLAVYEQALCLVTGALTAPITSEA